MIQQEFKNMYVIINTDGITIDYTSISCMKKWCIENFLKGTQLTWEYCYKVGYRCVKVNINIKKVIR